MMWSYGTIVLVRAKIIRVVGDTHEDRKRFRQQISDRRVYGREDRMWTEWPGISLPLDWADATDGWQLEPVPNGHPVVRCRRFELDEPARGIVIGARHLYEYTAVDGAREDYRRVDLCEIALPPAGKRGLHKDRTRLVLAHPHDAGPVPLTQLVQP